MISLIKTNGLNSGSTGNRLIFGDKKSCIKLDDDEHIKEPLKILIDNEKSKLFISNKINTARGC
jgi:hypothetical protein